MFSKISEILVTVRSVLQMTISKTEAPVRGRERYRFVHIDFSSLSNLGLWREIVTNILAL